MFLKFTTVKRLKTKLLIASLFSLIFLLFSNTSIANCKDKDLREKVTQTARSERVNEIELLSIIAHESNCNYFTVAWNLPRKPETAKSKKFQSLEEAKEWTESLIATKLYRVDVGIGQINNEAHIQPKKWSLDEILDPLTALKRVAQVLKERGWKKYHSNNPVLAKKWQLAALNDLNKIQLKNTGNNIQLKILTIRSTGPLVVFSKSLRKSLPSPSLYF